MRIDYLTIESVWKNLEGFHIDFDQRRDIGVIIGKNGSAKSNLLEALIIIFRNIDLGEPAAFAYTIRYLLETKAVTVTAQANKQPSASVEGEPISLDALRQTWTPRYVVGYYSGASDRFEELFADHDRKARDLTLKPARTRGRPEKLELRRFICARPVHGLFALLAFYFSRDDEISKFLREHPKIEDFDSALLTLHKPPWAKKAAKADDFWGAKGPVRELLERLRLQSLAPFARRVRVKRDFAKRETRDLMHLFLPGLSSLDAIAADYSRDPKALFQALDTMRLSDLIEDFRVRVKVSGVKGTIHTRQLSEGEQQLLTVFGLIRFTRNANSLYLLDEPDTHLNPAWEVDYLHMLRHVGGVERKSHTILATHDPLLVAGLLRDEVRILVRLQNGHITANVPEENPRGMGVAGVLTSELYGLESQLDVFSLEVLKRIYEVSQQEPSVLRTRHLARLRMLLPGLDTSETSPDPYRNIARDAYEIAQDIVLNRPEASDSKKRIIDRLAAQLVEHAAT